MESIVYSKEAKEVGKISLPEKIFGLKWNSDLVHQVLVSMRGNLRYPLAHTKTRGEVRGGGKKPWRQKGTGRARHGSIRSPIWRGGGVVFGPRKEKDYSRKINKKMKQKALWTILSAKLRDGELIFVDSLGLKSPKTKEAAQILNNFSGLSSFSKIAYKKGRRALILTFGKDENVIKSFRNFGSAVVEEARNLNPLLAATYKYVVFSNPEESLKLLSREK